MIHFGPSNGIIYFIICASVVFIGPCASKKSEAKMNGCLIKGMACTGGCVAGAGTNIAISQASKAVENFKDAAGKQVPDRH